MNCTLFYVFSTMILSNVIRGINVQELRLEDKMVVKVLES